MQSSTKPPANVNSRNSVYLHLCFRAQTPAATTTTYIVTLSHFFAFCSQGTFGLTGEFLLFDGFAGLFDGCLG